MKKNTLYFAIILLSIILSGCGQQQAQPPLYIWGNYIDSSAKYGMRGHEKEISEQHRMELEKIIEESREKKQRVAPGIYAEYGQLLFEANKKEQAKQYFILEKQTYPESSIFLDRVTTKLYGEKL